MKVLVIPWDESLDVVRLVDLDGLEAMQAVVGGMVECTTLVNLFNDGSALWCNEEYQYSPSCFVQEEDGTSRPKINTLATAICRANGTLMGPDGCCGDVFLTGGTDREGHTLDVPEAVVDAIFREGPR